ncbi:Coiled-coil domain-containing protein 25 [Rhizoclosmatium sp. JEL0117]|nr:Coiled-coil domain-containing protein 25 [Rhizoclosmatium sp. JEL0117]
MVLYFKSYLPDSDEPVVIYMGRDKFENEQLIEHGWEQDVWFHVDKISSAHVYLRMPDGMTWDAIPESLLIDLGQLTKANSIEGNKLNNQTILYTPWSNLKKTGGMETGQVTFHKTNLVKKVFIRERENAIVNRLNKTKEELYPDLAAQKIEKQKELRNAQRALEKQLRREEEERKKEYKQAAEMKSYKGVMDNEEEMKSNRYYSGMSVKEAEEDFM